MLNDDSLMSVETLAPEGSKGLLPSGSGKKFAGGALEAADKLNRNTALWTAPNMSADEEVRRNKQVLDNRSKDQIRNNGYVGGGVETYKDSVIGAVFKLNLKPNWKYLGLDKTWAQEFKEYVETRWNLYAESQACYADASRRFTASELLRISLGSFIAVGDCCVSSEWLPKSINNPYRTAFRMVDTDRICNPNGINDSNLLRRGIVIDKFGAHQSYWLRTAYVNSTYQDANAFDWKNIPAAKPWGRKMMLYYADTRRPEQTRAFSRLATAMKEMRMLDKYSDIVLQNAIVGATYAATIESELPRDIVYQQLGEMSAPGGGDSNALLAYMTNFLNIAAEYQGNSKNLSLNDVRIPHLLPGTKLSLQNAGNPGGIGTGFEASWLRHFARSIGISPEEFSGDFSNTNYSGAKASIATTERTMKAVKRQQADKMAFDMLSNWLEEDLNMEGSNAPMPRNAPNWYEGMNKQAYITGQFIGSSRGQLNELQETQAAALRLSIGISTREKEIARLGDDWTEVAQQRANEKELDDELGLEAPDPSAKKNGSQNTLSRSARRQGNKGNQQ